MKDSFTICLAFFRSMFKFLPKHPWYGLLLMLIMLLALALFSPVLVELVKK